jgi:hypothetical protein
MSGSLDHLPHIEEIPSLSRAQLLDKYGPIELEVRDIKVEIKRVLCQEQLGLPIDGERFKRLTYGKAIRERILLKMSARLQELRRAELGGDPQALQHRRFLHAVFDAVKDTAPPEVRDAIFERARQSGRRSKCELCSLQRSRDVERPDGVAEHVDAQHTESAVVRDLDQSNLMPPTLSGGENQG